MTTALGVYISSQISATGFDAKWSCILDISSRTKAQSAHHFVRKTANRHTFHTPIFIHIQISLGIDDCLSGSFYSLPPLDISVPLSGFRHDLEAMKTAVPHSRHFVPSPHVLQHASHHTTHLEYWHLCGYGTDHPVLSIRVMWTILVQRLHQHVPQSQKSTISCTTAASAVVNSPDIIQSGDMASLGAVLDKHCRGFETLKLAKARKSGSRYIILREVSTSPSPGCRHMAVLEGKGVGYLA